MTKEEYKAEMCKYCARKDLKHKETICSEYKEDVQTMWCENYIDVRECIGKICDECRGCN